MREKIIAKRYADAFMAYAQETIGINRGLNEFKQLKRIMMDNPEFQELLNNPGITYNEKCVFIDTVLGDSFSYEFKQCIKLALEKRRFTLIDEIAEYVRTAYTHGAAKETLVRSSYPLDLEFIKTLKNKLEQKFNSKLRFYLEIDPSLLGGIQIIMGTTIIDGSLLRRFEDLRNQLKQVRLVY